MKNTNTILAAIMYEGKIIIKNILILIAVIFITIFVASGDIWV